MRQFHELEFVDFPIQNKTETYLESVQANYKAKKYDSTFGKEYGFKNAEEAHELIEKKKHLLHTDTHIHGDFCLPNIILSLFPCKRSTEIRCFAPHLPHNVANTAITVSLIKRKRFKVKLV